MGAESQDLALAILDAAPNGILVIDESGRIRLVNRSVTRLLGYEEADLLGRPVELLIPDSLRADHVSHRASYAVQPVPRAMGDALPVVALHKDGREVPVEVSLSPLESSAFGRATIAIVRDVSQQRALLEELRESEARATHLADEARIAQSHLAALLEISPIGIVNVGLGGGILLMNEAAREICGVSAPVSLAEAEVSIEYRRPGGVPYAPGEMPLQRTLATGKDILREQVEFGDPDNGGRVALVSSAMVADDGGEPIGAVAIIQDISDLSHAQAERDAFVSMIRHEVANPLTVILGLAQRALRRMDGGSSEYAHAVRDIEQHAKVVGRLIDGLGEYEGVRRSRFEVEMETLPLQSFLLGVHGEFALLSARASDVELRLALDLGEASADPFRLQQVLLNLLGNAAKFSPDGSPIVLSAVGDGEWVRVAVADQGTGQDQESLRRLFTPFTRFHPDVPGTGLGLAISREIVRAHGGELTGDSDGPGLGATFSFTLRRALEPAVAAVV